MTSKSTNDNDFIEAVRDSYLIQHVMQPTGGRGTNEPSALDLKFTAGEQDIENMEVQAPLGKSDHAVIKSCFTLL